MKTIEELLSYISSLNVKLWVEDNKLHYNAPKGKLTANLLVQMRERKTEILQFLQKTDFKFIQPVERIEPLPLSFAQARLWLLEQIQPGSFAYNEPVALQFIGSLNVAVLKDSINEIIRRHEVLRTSFHVVEGQPVQVITPNLSVSLPVIDLCELPEIERKNEVQRLTTEQSQRIFALACSPLLRCTLLRLGEKEHIVFFTIHHIISDGWSLGLFLRELTTLYEAFIAGNPSPLPELTIQYADFAVWQRQWLQGEMLETQLSYWRKQLGNNLPVLELPTDYPRPIAQTFRGSTESLTLSQDLTAALKALGLQERVTLFMILIAAFKIVLHYHTDQDDLVVGTDVANRNRPEIENLIGAFTNQLVLRTYLGGNPTFRELLSRIREVTLKAYTHQDLPFEKLVEILNPERTLSRAPLFQVKIMLKNVPMPSLKLKDLTLNLINIHTGASKLDLFLSLRETEQVLQGYLEYNIQLFKITTIKKILLQFETVLSVIAQQPNINLNNLKAIIHEVENKQKNLELKYLEKASLRKLENFKRKASESSPSMEQINDKKNPTSINQHKLRNFKRKAVSLHSENLIKIDYFEYNKTFTLILRPALDNIDIVDWLENNQEFINIQLLKHGAILFRGFHVDNEFIFERFGLAICSELFNENGEHPRTNISGNVYTPVFYPADKQLLWHNENSFNHHWPIKILFGCRQPAKLGGETPIVDSRKVFELINPKIKEQFIEKKVMYIRNYGNGLGLNWETVFRTKNRSEVEAICTKARIDFEWKADNQLRTRAIRPAVIKHPKTGEISWFNQAQHWHPACLDLQTRESLLSSFREENFPRNCYYGDGTPIENSVMEEICQIYKHLEVCFPWLPGDVLLLDNVLTAHGRNPYVGERKQLVAMGEMMSFNET